MEHETPQAQRSQYLFPASHWDTNGSCCTLWLCEEQSRARSARKTAVELGDLTKDFGAYAGLCVGEGNVCCRQLEGA